MQAGCCGNYIIDLFYGGIQSDCQSGDRPKYFMAYTGLSMQMFGQYLEIGNDSLIPNSYSFTIHIHIQDCHTMQRNPKNGMKLDRFKCSNRHKLCKSVYSVNIFNSLNLTILWQIKHHVCQKINCDTNMFFLIIHCIFWLQTISRWHIDISQIYLIQVQTY